MLFSEWTFVFAFLPLTCLLAFAANRWFGHAATTIVLLIASLVFYGWGNPYLLFLIAASLIGNHVVVSVMLKRLDSRTADFLMVAGIVFNLSFITYFKYSNFILENIAAVGGWEFALEKLPLPLGISFYTFQQIAYLVDARYGKVKDHKFLSYALFVTFFPQLVAGPIVHHSEMMPQILRRSFGQFWTSRIIIGLSIFAIGLFKKTVLADSFALYVSPVYQLADSGADVPTLDAWIATLSYTLQIYFDFSGYSDMAIGLARLFGVRLPINFYSPYKSTGIIEFWRTWHMTLSRFLRDYVYIPLGGNRSGERRRTANLMATMLIGGLWHGASWNFVIWGGLHGLFLVINGLWNQYVGGSRNRTGSVPLWRSALAWFVTFNAVMLAWVFFRATTFDGALRILGAMAGFTKASAADAPLAIDARMVVMLMVGLAIALLAPNTQQIFRRYRPTFESPEPQRQLLPAVQWRYRAGWVALTAAVLGFACFYDNPYTEFLYWNF